MGEIKGIVVMLLVVSAVLIGMSGFYVDLQNTYGVVNKTESTAFMNATNRTLQLTKDLQTNLTQSPIAQIPILGVGYSFVVGGWKALMVSFSVIDITTSLVTDTATLSTGVSIPTWFISILIGIITVVILFAIFSAITQRDL